MNARRRVALATLAMLATMVASASCRAAGRGSPDLPSATLRLSAVVPETVLVTGRDAPEFELRGTIESLAEALRARGFKVTVGSGALSMRR